MKNQENHLQSPAYPIWCLTTPTLETTVLDHLYTLQLYFVILVTHTEILLSCSQGFFLPPFPLTQLKF